MKLKYINSIINIALEVFYAEDPKSAQRKTDNFSLVLLECVENYYEGKDGSKKLLFDMELFLLDRIKKLGLSRLEEEFVAKNLRNLLEIVLAGKAV